jgi:hypothetical protein
VIFGATTEVLFVTLAAFCDHRYRNRSFVTRWFEESCHIAVAMHREINLASFDALRCFLAGVLRYFR